MAVKTVLLVARDCDRYNSTNKSVDCSRHSEHWHCTIIRSTFTYCLHWSSIDRIHGIQSQRMLSQKCDLVSTSSQEMHQTNCGLQFVLGLSVMMPDLLSSFIILSFPCTWQVMFKRPRLSPFSVDAVDSKVLFAGYIFRWPPNSRDSVLEIVIHFCVICKT